MISLDKDNIGKLFLKYTIPSVMGMVVASIYVIVDGIFIGNKIGSNGLAAITISLPYISFIIALSLLLTVGGGTLTNIYLGKKEKKEASEIFSITIIALFLLSVVVTALSLVFLDKIVYFLGASDLLYNYVWDYLFYSIIFTFAYMIFYILDMGVKGTGNPGYSMKVIIFTSVLNIILDYIYIFPLDLGMKGAALASGTSHSIGTIILALYFIFINKDLNFKFIKIDLFLIIRMMKNGFSEFVNSSSSGITILLFNIILMNSYGEDGVAAYSIIGYATAFIIAVFFGISEGVLPIISYNYGANQIIRVKNTLFLSLKTVFYLGLSVTLFTIISPETLVKFFIKENQDLLVFSGYAIRIFSLSFLFNGFNIMISAFFTAIEEAKKSAFISVLRSLILVIVGIFILPKIIGDSGIWFVIPFAEAITFIYCLYLLRNQREYWK